MKSLTAFMLCTGLLYAADIQPPTYVCQRANTPLSIDGKAKEAAWQSAQPLSPLRDIEGPAIPNRTTIKLLWDDTYLYVYADMQEAQLWATLAQRDSVIYRDPDFEVFIDPDGDTKNYVEIEVNALNTVWDLLLTEPYRSGNLALHDWNIPGLKHAVHLRGTLNDSRDCDEGWSVEMAIPWVSIIGHSNHPRTVQPPAPGTTLRMNFSRVNWHVSPCADSPHGYAKKTDAQGNPLPETNHVWAATGEINIHMPEHWGYVRLSNSPAGVWEPMPLPAAHATEQQLFAYYNKQLAYKKENGVFNTAMQAPQGCNAPILTPEYFAVESTVARTGERVRLDSHANLTHTPATRNIPEIYLWVHGNNHPGDTVFWDKEFCNYAAAGVNVLIIGGTAEQIAALTPLAAKHGMQVYAWLWAANRPGDSLALQHPDWYAVNRIGKSCHAPQDRPFVEYYQF
ncbi:MAG: carbohydrate-binding family 9-like protein, partial [Akkermansia sp.]|nr:carbohydrate-binding family 9-like protein [Akkermansia sp.]